MKQLLIKTRVIKRRVIKKKVKPLWLLLSLMVASSTVLAQEQASVVRDTKLKAKPYTDSATLTLLNESQNVDVLSRQSSWLEVQAESLSGWVKMFSVRYTGQRVQTEGSFSGTKKVFNLITTGSSGSTVTTASRGLDENRFLEPHPNPRAFEVMQTFSISQSNAKAFAQDQSLKGQRKEYVSGSGDAAGDKS